MRIYFSSTTLPKKAAKRIQRYYFSPKDASFPPIKLSLAQEIAAQMLGYNSWYELNRATSTKEHSPSLLDEECPSAIQKQRLDFQTAILGRFSPLIEPVRRRIAIQLRVSAANPLAPILSEQSYAVNRIEAFKDPFTGRMEWRFFPSERSEAEYDNLWDDYDRWAQRQISFQNYNRLLEEKLRQRPEDLYVVEEMLRVALETDCPDFIRNRLDQFAQIVEQCIPPDFPKRKAVYFEWGTISNRTFHRVTFWLGQCYYKSRLYKAAKRWFAFNKRTCRCMNDGCKPYLQDLKRKVPTGHVEL